MISAPPLSVSSSVSRSVLRAVALLAVAASLLGACGGSEKKAGAEGSKVRDLKRDLLPADLLGLEVGSEPLTSAVKDQKRSYLDGVALYSFRKDDLLQATLQVSRFGKDAQYTKAKFRQAIITQIGITVPRPTQMGKQTVYLTTQKRQTVAVWFKGRFAFVLSTRDEFEQPRTLLREILEVKV